MCVPISEDRDLVLGGHRRTLERDSKPVRPSDCIATQRRNILFTQRMIRAFFKDSQFSDQMGAGEKNSKEWEEKF